jgi:nickel-dependent lactate racemase
MPEPVADLSAAVRAEMERTLPEVLSSASLSSKAVLCVTDVTRKCSEGLFLEVLASLLPEMGVTADMIEVLVAQGLHRSMTQSEKADKYGVSSQSMFRFHDHDATGGVGRLGTGASGVPIELSEALLKAGPVLSTGVVELHQYAGYSGGTKTVGIGCAGSGTISYTHSPQMVLDSRVCVGRLEGNPFRVCVDEVAGAARHAWCINEVHDPMGRTCAVAAGRPSDVLEKLVEFSRSSFTVRCGGGFDMVVAGVPNPKGANLYQASRAATYIALSGAPIIKPGGPIIIHAPCDEGAGAGAGEMAFFRLLSEISAPSELLARACEGGWKGGEQRALVVARALERNPVIVAGATCPGVVEACKMIPAPDIETAIGIGEARFGLVRRLAVVPEPFTVLPCP